MFYRFKNALLVNAREFFSPHLSITDHSGFLYMYLSSRKKNPQMKPTNKN